MDDDAFASDTLVPVPPLLFAAVLSVRLSTSTLEYFPPPAEIIPPSTMALVMLIVPLFDALIPPRESVSLGAIPVMLLLSSLEIAELRYCPTFVVVVLLPVFAVATGAAPSFGILEGREIVKRIVAPVQRKL